MSVLKKEKEIQNQDKSKDHHFEVYKSEELTPIGNIYVILTSGLHDTNGCKDYIRFGEYFVLFPDKANFTESTITNIVPQRIIFDTQLEEYCFDKDLDKKQFFLEQVKEMSEIAIQQYMKEEFRESDNNLVYNHYLRLKETEQSHLLGLWMRNKCKSEISYIIKKSLSLTLKRYLRSFQNNQLFGIQELVDK